jgi:hypothetical protein
VASEDIKNGKRLVLVKEAAKNYSVGEAVLSDAAPRRTGSLEGSWPGAALAASSAATSGQVATSSSGLTASASPPAAPVGSQTADESSVRHETSPVVGFS